SCFIAAGRYQSGPGALVLGRWSAGDVTLASPWNHPGITLARDERIAGRAARQRAPRRPNPSQGCLPRVAYPVPSDGIWPQGPPWFSQARQGPHPTSRFPHGQGVLGRVIKPWTRVTWTFATERCSPLRVSGPASSVVVVASTAALTLRSTRIWPSAASPHNRAARLTTVPMAA